MTEKLDVEFVLFDMIGTTVLDSNATESAILQSFRNAFHQQNIQVSNEIINEHRGKSKQVAIELILTQLNMGLDSAEQVYQNFMNELDDRILQFIEMPNASKVFSTLKSKGIKIGIGSGLPIQFMMTLLDHLSWKIDDFDYINSSQELQNGRPDPVMIYDAIDKLSINNKNRVLKIGDTVVDVLEGKNANVITALVLSGTHTKEMLAGIKPDFVWDKIDELLNVV